MNDELVRQDGKLESSTHPSPNTPFPTTTSPVQKSPLLCHVLVGIECVTRDNASAFESFSATYHDSKHSLMSKGEILTTSKRVTYPDK